MRSITVLGAGKVGGALAIALSRGGNPPNSVIYRSPSSIDKFSERLSKQTTLIPWEKFNEHGSEVLVIAAADPEIGKIAETLAENGRCWPIVLHTSGSLSSSELMPCQIMGASVGSMHPLVSISDPVLGAERFQRSYFCVEGDEKAVAAASEIAEAVGAVTFTINTEYKPLYHASAVMASGNLVALIDIAAEMLSKCGLEQSEAKRYLLPLVDSTIRNLAEQDTESALTGPFARGDVAAFRRHLESFNGRVPQDIRDLYLLLGLHSTEISMRGQACADDHLSLERAISMAKEKAR